MHVQLLTLGTEGVQVITRLGHHVADMYPEHDNMSKHGLREHYTKLLLAADKSAGRALFPDLENDDTDLLSNFFMAREVCAPDMHRVTVCLCTVRMSL